LQVRATVPSRLGLGPPRPRFARGSGDAGSSPKLKREKIGFLKLLLDSVPLTAAAKTIVSDADKS